MRLPTMVTDYPADMEPYRMTIHFYTAVIVSMNRKAGRMAAARTN